MSTRSEKTSSVLQMRLASEAPVGLAELAPHRSAGLQLTLFEELTPEGERP
jgi:hypothetical protein